MKEIEKEALSSVENKTDDQGRDIIRLNVKDDSHFLSNYSDKNMVNIEVAEYIDNSVKQKKLKNGLSIIISSGKINNEEKTVYSEAIRNHYRSRIVENNRKIKRYTITSIILLLIAFVTFIINFGLKVTVGGEILLELVDIIGWVFMWEAVDFFFFKRKEVKIENYKNLNIYSAEIIYKPITKNNKKTRN